MRIVCHQMIHIKKSSPIFSKPRKGSKNKLGRDLGEIVAIGAEICPKWDPGRSERLPFFGDTHFHSVTTQTQAVVTIYYHCIIFLLPFNGNSMCND